MCWAAADRLGKIAARIGLPERESYWRAAADRIRTAIETHGFNAQLNAYTAAWGGDTMDASLLLACELGYVGGRDPRFVGTVAAIEKALKPHGSFLFRYVVEDDFGMPENTFTICTFWYIDALAASGRKEEARAKGQSGSSLYPNCFTVSMASLSTGSFSRSRRMWTSMVRVPPVYW